MALTLLRVYFPGSARSWEGPFLILLVSPTTGLLGVCWSGSRIQYPKLPPCSCSQLRQPLASGSCLLFFSPSRPGLPGLAVPGLHNGAPGQPAILTLSLTWLKAGRVMALGAPILTHTMPAKQKTTWWTLRKSRFLSNFTAFVYELLWTKVASDLLPAPAWGWGEGDGRSAFAGAES